MDVEIGMSQEEVEIPEDEEALPLGDTPDKAKKSASPSESRAKVRTPPTKVQSDDENDSEPVYEVQSIERHRIKNRRYEFYVIWSNWPESDTWEPMENLLDAREYFESYLKSQNLRLLENEKTGKFSIEKVSSTRGPKKSLPSESKKPSVKKSPKGNSEKAQEKQAFKSLSSSSPAKTRRTRRDSSAEKVDSSSDAKKTSAGKRKSYSDRENSVEDLKAAKSVQKIREQSKRTKSSGPVKTKSFAVRTSPSRKVQKTFKKTSEPPVNMSGRSCLDSALKRRSRSTSNELEWGSPTRRKRREEAAKRRQHLSGTRGGNPSPHKKVTNPAKVFKENYDSSPDKNQKERGSEKRDRRRRYHSEEETAKSPRRGSKKPDDKVDDKSSTSSNNRVLASTRDRKGVPARSKESDRRLYDSDEETANTSRGSKKPDEKIDDKSSTTSINRTTVASTRNRKGATARPKESDSEGEFEEYTLEDPKRLDRKTGFQMGWIPDKIVGVTKVSQPLVYLVNWKNSKVLEPVRSLVLREKAPDLLIDFLESNMISKVGAAKRGKVEPRYS